MAARFGRVTAFALVGVLSACAAGNDDSAGDDSTRGSSSPPGSSDGATTSPGSSDGVTTSSGGDFGTIDPGGASGEGGGGTVPGQGNGESCDGKYTGTIRDFHDSFPDMEPGHSGKCDACDDRAIVADTLGADFKPVYAGDGQGTLTTTGPANFDMWYHDVEGVNYPLPLTLQFVDPEGDGVWTYDDQEFFPIDGAMFGNEGRPHNYHFTFEMHMGFIYHGGEKFTFAGDDDVFTYINGKKVVDLGGVHAQQIAVVDLDTLGLEVGQQYQLDFFFAERHVTDSHFRVETTIKFVNCGGDIR